MDIPQIENIIVNFTHLVSEKWSVIKEIEINPLLVSENGTIALDARVILHEPPSSMEVGGASNAKAIVRPAIRPYPTNYDQGWVSKNGKVILSKCIKNTRVFFLIALINEVFCCVLVRAIMPEDEPLVIDFHKRVSQESVYTRFFSDMRYEDRTSHDRLKRVCHVDYDRDIAIVALDGEKCSNSTCKMVAAARLTKKHGVSVAEFSILVSDAYQGQGALLH